MTLNPFTRRPWLLVVVVFILLIAAWTTLIVISEKNRPETVPLKGQAPVSGEAK